MLESSEEMPSVIASGGGSMRLNSDDRLSSVSRLRAAHDAQLDVRRLVQRQGQDCPQRALTDQRRQQRR